MTRLSLIKVLLLLPMTSMGMDFHALADAVAIAESNNNPEAVGDSGKARGAYQMWRIAWDQVNIVRAKEKRYRYPWAYAHDPFVSKQYAIDYLRWCAQVLKKDLGREPAFWEIYACYARGPSVFKKEHDYAYASLPSRTKRAIGVIAARIHEREPR